MRFTRLDVGTALLCAVAAATAGVLGLITLGRRSLWIDEATDISLRELPWRAYLEIAFHQEGSQALYLLFLRPWLAATSTEEWVARIPSVAFAATAAAVLVALGIRLFQSRMIGLGAGLLLATNGLVVSWSQQVRTYALATLLAVVVTYLFVQALESDGLRWWLVYGIAAGVSVYSQFFIALVLASHIPALVLARRETTLRRWAVSAAIAFVIAVPALDFAFRHDQGQVSWISELTYDYLRSVVHDVSGESWLVSAVAFVGLALLLFAVGRGGRDAWRAALVASWLIVPLVGAIAISYFKPMLVARYLIVLVPALSLAASYAISKLGRRAGVAALAVLLAVGLVHVRDWYRSPVPENWRGAVAYAEQGRQPDERILVYPSFMAAPVVYYGGPEIDTSQQLTGDRARVVAYVQDAPAIEEWLSNSGYQAVARTNFGAVDVWQVARSVPG